MFGKSEIFRHEIFEPSRPRAYGNENGRTYARILGKVPSRFGRKSKIGKKDEIGQPTGS